MNKKNLIFIFVAFLITTFLNAGDILSPEKFLGFKPGTDKHLAHYNQIKEYFFKVGDASPRVKIFNIGKTTLNNDMILAAISSPENIQNLDKYKEISGKLSQAKVDENEARQLAKEGKTIVFVTCSLHSIEVGASQMSMEMLYHMATDNSPETLNILNNVIFVLVPCANPDGQIMEVEWYNKYKGTQYEGCNLPYLYHWYAGHDDNRDWYKLNLKETRNLTRELYHNWFPQIELDEHQMGSDGDRFFVPPFADPVSPDLHPLVWRTINLIGTKVAYDLEKKNLPGVASLGMFQGWWIGALDDTAWFHNMHGILFEAASARMATPIYIEPEEVVSPLNYNNQEMMFMPNPWKGGWWKLSDIMNYHYNGTLSVLNTAATLSQDFLYDSYKMAVDNIEKGKTQAPFAYIIPGNQPDPVTIDKLVKTLKLSNLDIYRLSAPLITAGQHFPEGSYVIPMAQPYRGFAKNIFDYQRYPDLRKNPKDDLILPYDGAAWTLPLGMGVETAKIDLPFNAQMIPVQLDDVFKRSFPENLQEYLVLESSQNNSFLAASVLLKKGIPVWRNLNSSVLTKGSFIIKKSPEVLAVLKEINATMPLIIQSQASLPLDQFKPLKSFKLAVYQNWNENMEEGWLRFVLDEYKIDFETIHPKDFEKKDLLKKYDVVVFIGVSKTEIESGKPPKKEESWMTIEPPDYCGGIGEKGKTALSEFLKEGKTLIFMTFACNYAIEQFKLPVKDINGEETPVTKCPGSYLSAEIKESDLTFGMGKKAAVYFNDHPAFSTDLPKSADIARRTPVVFGLNNLLLSGAIQSEDPLRRKSEVVDFSIGKGRLILIGPDIIFRGQSENTYKILFNALFASVIK